jgi:nucleoside-diphosphate-sugar epimerase
VDVELYPAYMTNIVGTQNILNFASKCPNLEYFHYLSTVAVKGLFKFDLFEDPLKFPKTNYLDNYSYTKAAAESLVKKADLGEIKKRIYRPGAVIGDTKTGTVEKIDGPYYFLAWLERHPLLTHLVRLLPIIPLPVSPETPLPFIAVDVLCDWLEMMILRPQERDSIRIYNMVSREPIPYSDFLEAVKEHYRLKGRFVSITNHTFAVLVGKFFSMPHQLISYMNSTGYFTTQNRADDYPSLEDFHFKSMIDSFFAGTSRFFQNKENQK